MGNDAFLNATYVQTAAFCACLAIGAYLWLRRPAEGILRALGWRDWERVLKRSYPISTILLAIAGFMGVSYYFEGCESRSYSQIVSDRSYILSVRIRQEQSTLVWIAYGVLVWAAVIVLCIRMIQREQASRKSSKSESSDG